MRDSLHPELKRVTFPVSSEFQEVVIVCSRNRKGRLSDLVRGLIARKDLDEARIVVVDSSDEEISDQDLIIGTEDRLTVLRSESGLPRQRNLGLKYVRSSFPAGAIVHFLDDDVWPSERYFSSAKEAILSHQGKVMIGSQDVNHSESFSSSALQLIGYKGKPGKVSRFGLSTPPIAPSKGNQWCPGHGFSFAPQILAEFWFDESIEFFGEDIEAMLRISELVPIVLTENSTLDHQPGPRHGKAYYYDSNEVKVRVMLSNKFPLIVRRSSLIFALVLEATVISLATPFSHGARIMLRARRDSIRDLNLKPAPSRT